MTAGPAVFVSEYVHSAAPNLRNQGYSAEQIDALKAMERDAFFRLLWSDQQPVEVRGALMAAVIARDNEMGAGAHTILNDLRTKGKRAVAAVLDGLGYRPFKSRHGEIVGIHHRGESLGGGTLVPWTEVGLGAGE
ncbi:MAG: hypothetical protein PHO20_01275 [Candidatus Peribacteraceae bacterium]|nr:hypothetical protein [Candidatus Peribacteraceae bacterium]MDD5739379.1 hypothetical protein [Candidatus Peribacteraceae bacterium]